MWLTVQTLYGRKRVGKCPFFVQLTHQNVIVLGATWNCLLLHLLHWSPSGDAYLAIKYDVNGREYHHPVTAASALEFCIGTPLISMVQVP